MLSPGEIVKEANGTWTYRSTCTLCGQPSQVTGLRKRALDRWDFGKGDYVQVAFPGLSADDREILISGTHGECFDKAFPPEEEIEPPAWWEDEYYLPGEDDF